MKMNILKQDKVASTIAIINQQLKMALNKAHSKDNSYMYYTFKGNAVEQIIDFITVRNAKSALVIDDVGLQIVNRLIQEGISDITLCLTRFPEEYLYRIKYIILKSFPNIKIKIIHYKELIIMNPRKKVDLVIANTPYGAIGANISYELKDKVDYKEFINLLPANDYKRNKTKDLFNYQSEMEAINDGFEDATVTTHLARLHKNKINDMTFDEFEVSQYQNESLKKYFKENISRPLGSLANYDHGANRLKEWTVENTFVFVDRVAANANPFSKNPNSKSADYLWNIKALEDTSYNLTYNYFMQFNSDRATKAGKTENHFCGIIFKTKIERINFTNFIYSDLGNAFIKKVLKAMQKDGWVQIMYWMPRPLSGSWTRAWTVEEILADYGYTETEIAEVIADLKN